MIALLLALLVEGRNYHTVAVKDIPRTVHTHVCTTGTVTLVKREDDGDVHIRIEDGGTFIVAEIVPAIALPRPRKGQRITVCGITREDKKHAWFEVHPIETWTLATP